MATLIPSEKHWQVAPTRCLPSPSILTRFATESTAGWQAPRNRQLPFDRLMSPWGQKNAVLTVGRTLPVFPNKQTFSVSIGMSQRCPKAEVAPSRAGVVFLWTEMVLALPSAMIGVHPVRNSHMRPDLQNIDTNGIRLRVALAGQGPLVILIHGFPESWYSWRHQIPALADAGYRVAAPDMRGYGGSDKPPAIEAYSIKNMCADIGGLIAALGAERAIVVGHDWGAAIAYGTALFHPERVRAVAGLSVPYLGRGPMPSVQLFRNIYKDR